MFVRYPHGGIVRNYKVDLEPVEDPWRDPIVTNILADSIFAAVLSAESAYPGFVVYNCKEDNTP